MKLRTTFIGIFSVCRIILFFLFCLYNYDGRATGSFAFSLCSTKLCYLIAKFVKSTRLQMELTHKHLDTESPMFQERVAAEVRKYDTSYEAVEDPLLW